MYIMYIDMTCGDGGKIELMWWSGARTCPVEDD